jgi:HEAT repeat protein
MPLLQGECPNCKRNVDEFTNQATYLEKLIQALRSREPQTAKRSAWILGELRDSRALEPLLQVLRDSSDIYFMAEVLTALGKLGSPEAIDVLQYHALQGAMPVRLAAMRALERCQSCQTRQTGDSIDSMTENTDV